MKLNLGCGFNKYEGYTNVDSAPECAPDIVCNLEETPWPWEDSSVSEIRMEHVLEHLGETSERYLAIWQELYRVGADGCEIKIVVPHWNHDNFHNDPTHKRPVTPEGIELFDQARNVRDKNRRPPLEPRQFPQRPDAQAARDAGGAGAFRSGAQRARYRKRRTRHEARTLSQH